MKKKLWFRAKDYGWGWQPVTWQGWLLVVGYIAAMVFNTLRIDKASHSASDTLMNFIPQAIILTAILIWAASAFGERPEWRWAGKRVPARVVLFKSIILVAIFSLLIAVVMAVLNFFGLVVSK